MKSNQCDAKNKFTFLLQKWLVLKRLPSAKIAEQAKEQFRTFLNDTVSLEYEKFQLFDKFKDRVDVFLGNYLSAEKYCHVFPVFQLICTLSHGQSFIERGFNINKEHLVDNLQEESLIALRTVNDYMIANSLSPTTIQISKKMLTSVGLSRQRYAQALEEKKKIEREQEKSRKRKQVFEQISEIAEKKKSISSSIEKDLKRSDELSFRAESEKDFSLLHMANSLKDLVKEKKKELVVVDQEEKQLKEKSFE